MMTTATAIRMGERAAKMARATLSGAALTAWAEEQGRKSDEAAARGDEQQAARYAAAYVAQSIAYSVGKFHPDYAFVNGLG